MSFGEEAKFFCYNVKYLREREGLSQKQMAKICGVGAASIEKLEQGIIPKRLSSGVIMRIACHFHINPGSLFIKLPDSRET